MDKKIVYAIIFLLMSLTLVISGCNESEDFDGAGASSISYPLNSSPLITDQVLGIDDPTGTWAINRFSFGDIWTLYLTQDLSPTGSVDLTGASGAVLIGRQSNQIFYDGTYTDTTNTFSWTQNRTTTRGDYDSQTVAASEVGADGVVTGVKTVTPGTGMTNSGTATDPILNVTGGGTGYVATPTYSDDTCTTGQYSWDGTYYYGCEATNQWDRFAVTWAAWDNPTPIIPTFTSATVDGDQLTMNFDVAVTQGAGWLETLFTVDATVTGSDIGMTVDSGNGTAQWVATLDTAVVEADTVTLDYPTTANGVESSTGDDLAALTGESVTNNTSGTSPISQYRFEDGALTTDSVGTNTLTNTGPAIADTVNYKEGSASTAVSGVTPEFYERTDTSLSSDFPLKSGTSNLALTWAFWVRTTGISTDAYIVSKYNRDSVNQRSFAIIWDNDDTIYAIQGHTAGASAEIGDPTATLTDNRWYHVAVTYDDATRNYKIRVWDDFNSTQLTNVTGTFTNNISLTVADFMVGTRDDGANSYFYGNIDDLQVFNVALSDAEIDALR